MTELNMDACENAGGGLGLFTLFSAFGFGAKVADALYDGVNALGATLRNYYGDDATLESFRGGNLGA